MVHSPTRMVVFVVNSMTVHAGIKWLYVRVRQRRTPLPEDLINRDKSLALGKR